MWDAYPSPHPYCAPASYFYCARPIASNQWRQHHPTEACASAPPQNPLFVNNNTAIGVYIQGPGGNLIENNVFADPLQQAILIDDSPNNCHQE